MNNTIVMGTSIAPFDYEKQAACIRSWVNSNISVVVFNTDEEIVVLREILKDLDVVFYPIQRDAFEISGKHLPFIQDILDITASMAERACGYFNSDIYIDSSDLDLTQFISKETNDSIMITHRNEIEDYSDIDHMNWTINLDGIDAFFVDKNLSHNLFGDEAYVQTVWDGFLIAHCRRKGIILKTLINPVFFHKRHKVRWDYERVKKSYDLVLEKYYYNMKTWRDLYFERYETFFDYSKDVVYKDKEIDNILILSCDEDKDYIEDFCRKYIPDRHYSIETSEKNRNEYTTIIVVPKGVRLRYTFFDFIDYLTFRYSFDELSIGCFFMSELDKKNIYNQLNRSLGQLREYNLPDELCVKIIINNQVKKEKYNRVKLVYPVCYRQIDIFGSYVDRIKIDYPTYIYPAGYSAGVWYTINQERLNDDIKGFLDMDLAKCGTMMAGKQILWLDNVCNIDDCNVILCSKYYLNEIREELRKRNFDKYINGDEILLIDKGVVYLFNFLKYVETIYTK